MLDHDRRDSSLKYEADQPDDKRAVPEAWEDVVVWFSATCRNRPEATLSAESGDVRSNNM